MIKRVGVIGASGNVGRGVVALLSEEKNIILRIGCRKIENLNQEFRRIEAVSVDLYEDAELEAFITGCDLVINCAGPAYKVMTRVAESCFKQSVSYIDVAGNKSQYQKLVDLAFKYPHAGGIISAGIYPGLAEMLAIWAIGKAGGKIKVLEEIFYGNNDLSKNAAIDICDTLNSDEGNAFSYCCNGEVRKIDFKVKGNIKLPGLGEQINLIPVVYEEFAEAMKSSGIEQAIFYNSFADQDKMNNFIKLKEQLEAKTDISDDLVQQIRNIFWSPGQGRKFLLLIELEAENCGHSIRKRHLITGKRDWNIVTGYVAGAIALQLLERGLACTGIHFASQTADIAKLLEILKSKLDIEIRSFQKTIDTEK